MAGLPDDICPEGKVTPHITRRASLRDAVDGDLRRRGPPLPRAPRTRQDHLRPARPRSPRPAPPRATCSCSPPSAPTPRPCPRDLRGQIGTRFALRTMNWQASETILGAGTYTAGLDSSKFLRTHLGVGILLGQRRQPGHRRRSRHRAHPPARPRRPAPDLRAGPPAPHRRRHPHRHRRRRAGDRPRRPSGACSTTSSTCSSPARTGCGPRPSAPASRGSGPTSTTAGTPPRWPTPCVPSASTPPRSGAAPPAGDGANRRGVARQAVLDAIAAAAPPKATNRRRIDGAERLAGRRL